MEGNTKSVRSLVELCLKMESMIIDVELEIGFRGRDGWLNKKNVNFEGGNGVISLLCILEGN